MKDVIYLAATVVFFGLSWLYVRGLERLQEDGVTLDYLIGIVLSLLLLGYLVYALLQPERF